MKPKLYIKPYMNGSKSIKALISSFNSDSASPQLFKLKTPKKFGSVKQEDFVINWGEGKTAYHGHATTFNRSAVIVQATNKLNFFLSSQRCNDYVTPEWTSDIEVAKEWPMCVSRTLLRGSSGRGIYITSKGEQPPTSKLYVKYVKKQKEFRIHVFGDKVFDCQRKIRDPNKDPIDWQVRSHDNGFIYARDSGDPTDLSKSMAIAAVKHVGLDFGAVDIIENKSGSYVLEINTAPGLEGQTVQSYREGFKYLLEKAS